MLVIDKFVIDGVRYMVWNDTFTMPTRDGIAMLLSSRDGVGADYILSGEGADVRCCDATGAAVEADSTARVIAAHVESCASVMPGIEHIEVRLTDGYASRIMNAGASVRVAG